MFTGLIQNLGAVLKIDSLDQGIRIGINPEKVFEDLKIGESIAVNGCCLTLISVDSQKLYFDISPETLRVTSLAGISLASTLNLERALLPTDRLGGHFVLGHVDCTGTIESLQNCGAFWNIEVSYPEKFQALLISKGSVCVDGISLTVNQLQDENKLFCLTVIPETWNNTNCKFWKKSQLVNLEFDVLGKYALRRLACSLD